MSYLRKFGVYALPMWKGVPGNVCDILLHDEYTYGTCLSLVVFYPIYNT